MPPSSARLFAFHHLKLGKLHFASLAHTKLNLLLNSSEKRVLNYKFYNVHANPQNIDPPSERTPSTTYEKGKMENRPNRFNKKRLANAKDLKLGPLLASHEL